MKLILNSRGFNTKSGTSQIYDAIKNDDLKEKKIFICSYPDYEIDERILENCVSIGFQEGNVLFARDGIPDETVSYIYVGEGNTFEILDYMRKQGLCTYIMEACKAGAIYIGSSAGACIAGADIRIALDFDSNYVGMRDFTGLRLFDGAIVPHYTKEQMKRYLSESDYELIHSYTKLYNVDNDHVLILNS